MVFDGGLHQFSALAHVLLSFMLRQFQMKYAKSVLDFSPSHLTLHLKEKEATPPYSNERSKSVSCLKSPQKSLSIADKELPPPIPPLPLNYQRSDGE